MIRAVGFDMDGVLIDSEMLYFTEAFRKEAPDVLWKLQEKGLRLALASSNGLAIVEKVLTDNGIRDFFEVVVSGESFRKSKPDFKCHGFPVPLLR